MDVEQLCTAEDLIHSVTASQPLPTSQHFSPTTLVSHDRMRASYPCIHHVGHLNQSAQALRLNLTPLLLTDECRRSEEAIRLGLSSFAVPRRATKEVQVLSQPLCFLSLHSAFTALELRIAQHPRLSVTHT